MVVKVCVYWGRGSDPTAVKTLRKDVWDAL